MTGKPIKKHTWFQTSAGTFKEVVGKAGSEIFAEIEATISDIDSYDFGVQVGGGVNVVIGLKLLKELERQLWSRYAQVPA